MANCVITKGRGKACKSQAGVAAIYIGNETEIGYTYGASASDLNQITAFTGATTSFYRISQPINTAGYTETATINEQTGTAVFSQNLEFSTFGVSQDMADDVSAIVRGNWRVLIQDRNGNYFLLGEKIAAYVSAFTGGFGKAGNDLNGYTITLTTESGSSITQVTSTAAASVISTATA